MPRGMRSKWMIFPLVVATVAYSVSGCGRKDLEGYRPASDHTRDAAPETVADSLPPADKPDVAVSMTSAASPTTDTVVPELPPVSALVPVNVVDGANVRALMSVPSIDSSPRSGSTTLTSSVSPTKNAASDLAANEPRQIELLIKEKSFRPDPKTGALRVSFDDLDLLKVLNMEPVVENAPELMPAWLQGLNGKLIRIRGFMYPTYDTEGIEHFVLARDNQICCFGRDPKIYDLIQIDMKAGKTTNYIPATRAFDVIGKFKIEMQAQDGKPYGLYVIEQAEVIDR